MSARQPFGDYTPRTHGSATLESMAEEVRRELNVRKRCYDRWLAEGNMTWFEGDSRMRAMMAILRLLNALNEEQLAVLLPAQVDEQQQPSIL